MARRTKKVGIAGKYGPRYGIRIRRRLQEVESQMRERHPCPECNTGILKRVGAGIYECRKCGIKIASSAYYPTPPRAITKKLEEAEEKEEEKKEPEKKVKKVKKVKVEHSKEEEKPSQEESELPEKPSGKKEKKKGEEKNV